MFAIALCTFASASLFAQGTALPSQNQNEQQTSVSQPGIIMGTITDVNDTPVSGASVALQGRDSSDLRLVTTDENGYFEIRDVEPGRPYQVNIRAAGFSEWDSPIVTLGSGQSEILDAKLRIEEVQTAVTVTPESSDEIATEQVKAQEKQRGFLIIPNFYAVYASNPAPLNARLKFRLALRVARDPFTFAGVAMLAGIGQATDYPDYAQGAIGYGERFATNYANSFTDIMLDGAILPSLLHQDPRYFYKGTGTIEGPRCPCGLQPNCHQRRQRALAAELFATGWRSDFCCHFKPLLSQSEPRRGTGLSRFRHQYRDTSGGPHARRVCFSTCEGKCGEGLALTEDRRNGVVGSERRGSG